MYVFEKYIKFYIGFVFFYVFLFKVYGNIGVMILGVFKMKIFRSVIIFCIFDSIFNDIIRYRLCLF